MARELSPTLTEQQKWGLITQPYLTARITKKWGGVIRYDFDSIYSGGEDESIHCATMPSDGSLIRLRQSGTPPADQLYYQRITNPDPGSDFSAWTAIGCQGATAIASASYGAVVIQVYVDSSQAIHERHSVDNGANWSAWAQLYWCPSPDIGCVAVAPRDADVWCIFFFRDSTLYRTRCTGWSFEAPAASPFTLTGASGLATAYKLNWLIVATSSGEVEGKGVYVSMLGDGNDLFIDSFIPWEAIISRGASEPYDYKAPFIMVD